MPEIDLIHPAKWCEPLWNCSDAAKFLNQKISTVRYWVHRKYIPHIRFANSVRFEPAKIRAWMQSMTRGESIAPTDDASGLADAEQKPRAADPKDISPPAACSPSTADESSPSEISLRILSEHRTRLPRTNGADDNGQERR